MHGAEMEAAQLKLNLHLVEFFASQGKVMATLSGQLQGQFLLTFCVLKDDSFVDFGALNT